MDDLFTPDSGPPENDGGKVSSNAPLAARFRPRTLEEYIGQGHLLAPGKPLRRLIEADRPDPERGLGKLQVDLTPEARAHLVATSEGDARRALNGLEIAALTTPPDPAGLVRLEAATIEECVQKKRVLYDKDEDQH